MAKYKTFDEFIKGEKIIRYTNLFKRCWNFATEAAVENLNDRITMAGSTLPQMPPSCFECPAAKHVTK